MPEIRTLIYGLGSEDRNKCPIGRLFKYWDTRSQNGGTVSIGKGVMNFKSNKQKLTVKSSTEVDIVSVREYLPYNIWLIIFMYHLDIL